MRTNKQRKRGNKTVVMLVAAGLLVASGAQAEYAFRVPVKGLRAATCETPWGELLVNGQQKSGYSVSSVPDGQSCVPIPVSCQNGTLVGSAPYGACVVSAPVWDNAFNPALKGTWTTHTDGLTEGLYGNVGSSFGMYGSTIDTQRDGVATKGHATGKWYFEMSSTDGLFRPGLYSGPSDPYIWAGPQGSTGSPVSLAADLDAGTLYVYNGACQLIDTRTFATGKTFYPAWQGGGAFSRSQTVTANFGGSAFRCAPPTGYNPGF